MKMKQFFSAVVICLLFTGCTTSEQLAKNLNGKSIIGDGTYVKSTIGIDTETKIPTIETRVISGNFADVKANQNIFDLSVKRSSSVFNAQAKTVLIRATLQTKNGTDIQNSVKSIADTLKEIYSKND